MPNFAVAILLSAKAGEAEEKKKEVELIVHAGSQELKDHFKLHETLAHVRKFAAKKFGMAEVDGWEIYRETSPGQLERLVPEKRLEDYQVKDGIVIVLQPTAQPYG